MAKDRVTMCNGRSYARELGIARCSRAACGKIIISRVEALDKTSLAGVLVLTVPAALEATPQVGNE